MNLYEACMRQILEKALIKLINEMGRVQERLYSLSDIELVYMLEVLWSSATIIKVAQNLIEDELGLLDSSMVVVVLSNDELDPLQDEKTIIAQARNVEDFFNLVAYFSSKNKLQGTVIADTMPPDELAAIEKRLLYYS